ncbi:MAG: tetratricopeptide repeat protein [Kiritimatiellae bacterium]|nr:tetratricopeptide repeat protein [Kiritimatiellia bacterium]MDD4340873.1 tetratricopeptide repeat protein [Kiritimatiellia bacterium]
MGRFAIGVMLALLAVPSALGLTAEEQVRFADGIYLRGFYETAVGEYLVFLGDFPEHPQAPVVLYRAGECYRQMSNQAGAERFYKRVATEYPESPQAARAGLRRAEFALADGHAGEARTLLNNVLTAKPPAETAAAATYYLGLAEHKDGADDAAVKAFEKVLQTYAATPHAAYAALELTALHDGQKSNEDNMAGWFEAAVKAAATPSAKAEALYRWGDWAYRNGDYQLAADTLQALLVEWPEERRARDARLALAWSLYQLDRTAEALDAAEGLIESAADADTAASGLYLRANCLRRMNRDGEALIDYESIARQYPGTAFAARAAYETMVTHFKRGDYARALTAMPPQPDSAQAADVLWMRAECERELGRLQLARGRYEELVAEYTRSSQAPAALMRLGEMAREAGRFDDAATHFRRIADDYPRDDAAIEALKAAARARLRAGDPAGALSDWDALLARKIPAATAAEGRLQKALVLIELGRGGEAAELLDELLAAKPAPDQAARAHYWRGVLLADDEDWAEAESALRSCLAAGADSPTATLARLRLAVVLQRQDRMDEAADQVETLLTDPLRVGENPALIQWLIRHRFDQDELARALTAAEALAAHAAQASWQQIAWYWVGASQSALGHETEAIAAYEQAVALDAQTREGAEAQLLLAGLELKAGRHERAAERFAAAAHAASSAETLDLRVRAYFGLGEAAEAAGEFDKAARHFMSVAVLFDDPEWTPHALFRAGGLFGQAGKPDPQEAAWRELRERYPQSSFARRVKAGAP